MKLYVGGYLNYYLAGRKSPVEVALNQPTLLREVLLGEGIPLEEVHLAAVNGSQVDLGEAMVENTDEARVFSSVNGG